MLVVRVQGPVPVMLIAVGWPRPGSVPRNHSARVRALVSVAVPFRVTVVAPWVGFGVAVRAETTGRTLSTTRVPVANGPQFPAASRPCTETVCDPFPNAATG